MIDAADVAMLIAAWGSGPGLGQTVDLDADGLINASDLAIVLGAWGPCEP